MATLQDRVVWITGAGSGIGRAIAKGFAAAGARVALTGRRVDPLAQTASEIGQAAIVVPADVTHAGQVAEAYETVKKAALMLQAEDIATAALFAAGLPPRATVSEMTIVPTDNQAWRSYAQAIANG